MTPYEQAAKQCEDGRDALTFEQQLLYHTYNPTGHVFITPELFMMGRPVDSSADDALLWDINHVFPRESHDAWLVHLAAGNIAGAMRFLPYRLPYVMFHRPDGWRKYPLERVQSFLAFTANPMQETAAANVAAVLNHAATATTPRFPPATTAV